MEFFLAKESLWGQQWSFFKQESLWGQKWAQCPNKRAFDVFWKWSVMVIIFYDGYYFNCDGYYDGYHFPSAEWK